MKSRCVVRCGSIGGLNLWEHISGTHCRRSRSNILLLVEMETILINESPHTIFTFCKIHVIHMTPDGYWSTHGIAGQSSCKICFSLMLP